jgi:Tfp pilus assembly protein PilO
MKLKSKRFFVVLVAANVAALLAVVFFVGLILTKNQNFSALRNQLGEGQAKLADLQSLKNLVDNIKEQQSYLMGRFVNKDKIIDFLSQIESLGEVSGAKVSIISVDEGNAGDPQDIVRVSFNAAGSWAQVFKTISLIDHLPIAFSVSRMQISKEISEGDTIKGKSGPARSFWNAAVEATAIKLH